MPNQILRRPGKSEPAGLAWWVVMAILYTPFSMMFKLKQLNAKKIPQTGPAIIVLNHIAHLDPLAISKFVFDAGRRPRFMAKQAIFDAPVAGFAMKRMGHIPVKRESIDANDALSAAVKALQNGGVIILHPEGTVTRDPDGWPMQAKTGAARLAQLCPDVPVIPIAQWGFQEQINFYTKKFKFFPRAKHTASVGDPIDLSAFKGRGTDAKTLHEMTDVIMKRLRHDLAEMRGVPEPTGDLFVWKRSDDKKAS